MRRTAQQAEHCLAIVMNGGPVITRLPRRGRSPCGPRRVTGFTPQLRRCPLTSLPDLLAVVRPALGGSHPKPRRQVDLRRGQVSVTEDGFDIGQRQGRVLAHPVGSRRKTCSAAADPSWRQIPLQCWSNCIAVSLSTASRRRFSQRR